MPEIRVARRYASALFGLAKRENSIDQVEKDLNQVEELLRRLPQLGQMLDHPVIPAERKKKLLRDALGAELCPLSLYFLDLLIDKRRTDTLSQVPAEFHALANAFRNVMEAQVWSAVPLSAEEEARLVGKLTSVTGKTVVLAKQVDPKLIGGVVVRVGDTVMDGSVTGQLRKIREQLVAGSL